MTMASTPQTPNLSQLPLYPLGVPAKFSPDGVVQPYPGNTTLCGVPADSPLQPGLQALHAHLSSHPVLSPKIQLLPPTSWHMTVVEGICVRASEPGTWPAGKEKKPLAECTAEFARRLGQLGLELGDEGLAPPYRMRSRGAVLSVAGIMLEVEGATVGEEVRMRRLRDRISDALGFKAPNHESYGFHISMAYLLRYLVEEEKRHLNEVLMQNLPAVQLEFELGAVEFCTFENMYAFSRLFHLGQKDEKMVKELEFRRIGPQSHVVPM